MTETPTPTSNDIHELKTMVTIIRIYLQLIAREIPTQVPENERLISYIEGLQGTIDRLVVWTRIVEEGPRIVGEMP